MVRFGRCTGNDNIFPEALPCDMLAPHHITATILSNEIAAKQQSEHVIHFLLKLDGKKKEGNLE